MLQQGSLGPGDLEGIFLDFCGFISFKKMYKIHFSGLGNLDVESRARDLESEKLGFKAH